MIFRKTGFSDYFLKLNFKSINSLILLSRFFRPYSAPYQRDILLLLSQTSVHQLVISRFYKIVTYNLNKELYTEVTTSIHAETEM